MSINDANRMLNVQPCRHLEVECEACGKYLGLDGERAEVPHERSAGAAQLDVGAYRESLEDMVCQFAYWSDSGGYWTGGLSALEHAFDVLGWDDPHPAPESRCDEPGCMKQATCGWPSDVGYRSGCGDHYQARLVAEGTDR